MKLKKGSSILLAMFILLLVSMSIMSVYTAFAKDKRNSEINIARLKDNSEITTYMTAAQISTMGYFSKREIPLMYTQYVEPGTEVTSGSGVGSPLIHRVLISDPLLFDTNDLTIEKYKGDDYAKLVSETQSKIAGFRYDISIYIDMEIDEINETLRLSTMLKDEDTQFFQDSSAKPKPEDSYSLKIKDVPLFILVDTLGWRYEFKVLVKNLEFHREYFEILKYSSSGDFIDTKGEDTGDSAYWGSSNSKGVVAGGFDFSNIIFEVVEAKQYKK